MRPVVCRTCGVTFDGYGKARYCSESCRHGTDAGYESGCKCDLCRAAHARNHKELRNRPRPDIDPIGARRRIQALACLGWSTAELSKHMGRHRSYLLKVLNAKTIEQSTAAAVAKVYDELSMNLSTGPVAGRTAASARARGWFPPLAWDDEDLDNPAAHPHVAQRPVDVDPVVVRRILTGEFSLPATREERAEVARRWHESGRSLQSLEQATGWKADRYFKISRDAA